MFAFATYTSPSYGEYQYPSYAITIGLFMGVIPFVPVVVMAFLEVVAAPGNTVFEVRSDYYMCRKPGSCPDYHPSLFLPTIAFFKYKISFVFAE